MKFVFVILSILIAVPAHAFDFIEDCPDGYICDNSGQSRKCQPFEVCRKGHIVDCDSKTHDKVDNESQTYWNYSCKIKDRYSKEGIIYYKGEWLRGEKRAGNPDVLVPPKPVSCDCEENGIENAYRCIMKTHPDTKTRYCAIDECLKYRVPDRYGIRCDIPPENMEAYLQELNEFELEEEPFEIAREGDRVVAVQPPAKIDMPDLSNPPDLFSVVSVAPEMQPAPVVSKLPAHPVASIAVHQSSSGELPPSPLEFPVIPEEPVFENLEESEVPAANPVAEEPAPAPAVQQKLKSVAISGNWDLDDANRFVDSDGTWNEARIAVDVAAGVALGAVGGFVVNSLVKSSQSDSGFDSVSCRVAGQDIAGWRDVVSVAARGLQ